MTPQFAPVATLAGYRMLEQERALGDYHLLIAPIVLQHDWGFADFFRKRHGETFIILDNGVIELDYPLPVKDLASAARVIGANVVVMPDTIDDTKQTVKQARHAVPLYRELDPGTPIMGVVQGRNLDECLKCAEDLHKIGVDWLAVPRGLTPHLQSRVPLLLSLAKQHGLPMHVLGLSNNLHDDVLAATCHPLVRGMDAATPMWAGKELPSQPPTDERASIGLGRRPVDYWRLPPATNALHNVKMLRQWLTDAQDAHFEGGAPADHTDPLTQI